MNINNRQLAAATVSTRFDFERRPELLFGRYDSGLQLDPLTGTANRIYFQEALARALSEPHGCVVLIYLDLDRFQLVNDCFSMRTGDRILREFSNRLSELCRQGEMVGRIGGDEFAVLARPTMDGPSMLVGETVERFRSALKEPFSSELGLIFLDASIGVAVVPGDATEADALMRKADLALHFAKNSGQKPYCAYEERLEARASAFHRLHQDLHAALLNDQLELAYQPIFSLISGRIASLEALLRWNHPEQGFISPSDFIPVAEQSGLINPLGRWVLLRACEEASGWLEPAKIAVNVSPLQLSQGTVLRDVTEALARSGLSPDRLELELTETVFLADGSETLATLRALQSMGVSLVLDDFGTGFSSLSYLRSFKFDKLKLDRSFVAALGSDPTSFTIARMVSQMASMLGIETVAEGVETPDQLAFLLLEGFQQVQGYFLAKPMAEHLVGEFLAHYTPLSGRR